MTTRKRHDLTIAITRQIRLSQSRTDAYDDAVGEALGINRTDHRCLDYLELEGRMTAGRLAELMGLTTGAMTTALDRLERAGYARRVRDEEDRRRVYVELTEKVHGIVWRYYEPLARLSEKLYEKYTDEQLALLLDFLESAAELYEPELARLKDRLSGGGASAAP